ncbi:unnamed protein product [Candida verbasci]|uniref:ditrans,polycis-polyprenyl diphosphate synthase [(2E,6E)-farnesyldiphosphate specific] n=1 Tax=Candida verbasci TaxID=1227364 RepID=A0A9W4TXX6_9ASCO|nr:unnamed protein product [Candida verbasci]
MIKSPKIIEDVRINNDIDVELKNITKEANIIDQKIDEPPIKGPPSTNRNINIFYIIMELIHNFLKSSFGNDKPVETTSILQLIIYYFNHLILLQLFFVIAIYKNIQFIYRKIYLKYLTLTSYPNKSPSVIRQDVVKLSKIPKVLSCLLDLKDDDDENGGKDGLINDICELTAWSISSSIERLIIYEYSGLLSQSYDSLIDLRKYIKKNLGLYFGTDAIPTFSIKIPQKNLIIYSNESKEVDIQIDLISRIDGKPTLVELTKTMSELALTKELALKDITIDLIDEELMELVGPEPDLLISFAPSLNLEDYPPWHIRLTEIYWEPDNKDVNYAVFIRALQQFSNCKINIGK